MLKVEDVLKELVKCNTIKDKENAQILDYIEKTLSSMGFYTEKRDKFLIMYNKKETPLGFLGHTDTVDFTNGWNYDKFDLTKVQNKLYGLGVCDMKAGIAAIIAAISQCNFQTKGMKLYFTYDEEIGFAGIKEVVNYEKAFPEAMIIGEPTNNEMVVGSKGLMEYRISFQGITTHSSTPENGKSAIMSAVAFICELNSFYQEELKKNLNSNFEIPYTTMNIGKINGGTSINAVPDACEFLVDFRTTDSIAEQKIIDKLENLSKKYQCDIEMLNQLSAFLNISELSNKTCNFITEASFFESNRMILGAGPVTAHEVNECITTESLYQLVEQYKALIEKYCY